MKHVLNLIMVGTAIGAMWTLSAVFPVYIIAPLVIVVVIMPLLIWAYLTGDEDASGNV